MSRKITLNIKGESSKQYTTLILELNLIAKSWSKFGVNITLPGKEKTIKWGQKTGRDTPRKHHTNGTSSQQFYQFCRSRPRNH